MTTPAAYDEKATPVVILAGTKWPVPLLAPRQLRTGRRLIIDVTLALNPTLADGDDPLKPVLPPKVTADEKLVVMSNETYESLTEIVYLGLTRLHPEMTRDEFLDMPITDAEMYLAFLVVRRQSQVYAAPPASIAAKPDADQGEA